MSKEFTINAGVDALKIELEKKQDAVGKVRDDLRDFISSAGDLLESCERACESLECAVDSLSELA